jgi:hypothetical protein
MKQLGGFEGLQQVIPVRLDYLGHELVVSGRGR